MPIVNFSIPKILEQKIRGIVRKKGFLSKAELFRFAVIHYLDEIERLPLDRNSRITALSQELEKEAVSKFGRKPLPPLEKQLARLKYL
jgi:metal-responsive CopG/Arc/MetJ family transcriptional regulator